MVTLEPSMGAGLNKAFLRVVGTAAGGAAGLAALYLAFAAAGGRDWEGEATGGPAWAAGAAGAAGVEGAERTCRRCGGGCAGSLGRHTGA